MSVKNTEVLVDASTGPNFKFGDQIHFLNADLQITGRGEVTKLSTSGQKVLIHLSSGQAHIGMSLEVVDQRLKTELLENCLVGAKGRQKLLNRQAVFYQILFSAFGLDPILAISTDQSLQLFIELVLPK